MIINAFVDKLTSRLGVANDTKPRSCFAQKHGLKGEVSSFLSPILRRRGGETLCLGQTRNTRPPSKRPAPARPTSASSKSWPRPQSRPEPVAEKLLGLSSRVRSNNPSLK